MANLSNALTVEQRKIDGSVAAARRGVSREERFVENGGKIFAVILSLQNVSKRTP